MKCIECNKDATVLTSPENTLQFALCTECAKKRTTKGSWWQGYYIDTDNLFEKLLK